MSDIINYELKKPFNYAYKGDTQEASFISLQPPTMKELTHITPIKQALMAAISQVSDTVDSGNAETPVDDSKPTAAMMMAVLYRWDGDLNKLLLHAKELFKSGAGLIDGETKFTMPLIEKMDVKDFEAIVGEYIASFLAPSLMDGE